MELDECFSTGKLRKAPVDVEKIKTSLEVAQEQLETSKKLFKDLYYGPAIIYAYSSAFLTLKSALMMEGIVEKSHYCTVLYIKENVSWIPVELVNVVDMYRRTRHSIMYGFSPSKEYNEEDAKLIIETAERLISLVRSRLKG